MAVPHTCCLKYIVKSGHAMAQLVVALGYKPVGFPMMFF